MIALLILLMINAFLLMNFREDSTLTIVKEKYKILREHLKATENENFDMLYDEIPIFAYRGSTLSGIGYNSNKGGEIGICVDGTPNHVFHVLLHELAHCTVDEYSHSPGFWKNYKELKNEAISIGIYENIDELTSFCGKKIIDK